MTGNDTRTGNLIDDLPFPMIVGVCSNTPRPSVQNNHSKGSQFWRRDVWHIRKSGMRTQCGRDSSEWLNMGEMRPDGDLCQRCARKAGV